MKMFCRHLSKITGLIERNRCAGVISRLCSNSEQPKDADRPVQLNPAGQPRLQRNKIKRNLAREELANLPKDELVTMVMKLETDRNLLKQIIQKSEPKTSKERKSPMDISKFHKRHILLRFCYLGWRFQGYAVQDNSPETIEKKIFDALTKTSLIASRQTSNYHGCGRTDKGVSAFEQVISIDVRSKVDPSLQLTSAGVKAEVNYCSLLNKVLPREIQAIAWRPVNDPNYSARFDCTNRTYKYFFPRGDLNVERMREASQHLVGTHDFRNFCKIDVENGKINYLRRIESADIKVASTNHELKEEFDMFCLELSGQSYARHMIRCIVAILMLVGKGKESPEIVRQLLDVETVDRKPFFGFAKESPLNLFSCKFRDETNEDKTSNKEMLNQWIYDEEVMRQLVVNFQTHWCLSATKTAMTYDMLKALSDEYKSRFPDKPEIIGQADFLNVHNNLVRYQKILDRARGPTLDDKIECFKRKNRLETNSEVENKSVANS